MEPRRDPVERADDDARDLYDVSTWEQRTLLDRVATTVYSLLVWGGRGLVVLVALGLLVVQFLAGGLAPTVADPQVLAMLVLSVVPALLLAAYVWRADVTSNEPAWLLGITFVLGVLLATFAAVANTTVLFTATLVGLGDALGPLFVPLFFYLVVGPVEETVKVLAVRLYAFGNGRFDSVVDGAVYGAVAGLGFASIENLLYISRVVDEVGNAALLGPGGGITAVRALAGPGHVIYSAFAGYYLGLAKFNRKNRGPIVIKGLLIAAFVHGTYNTLVGVVPAAMNEHVVALGELPWFVAFVVVYDGVFGYLLYRKLSRYASVYRSVGPADRDDEEIRPELTEFES